MDGTGTKTILVTGASSGFGRATADLFASRGWNVAATMRRSDAAGLFAGGDNVRVFQLDVTNAADIDAAAERAIGAFGRVDVLVNNAGYAQMGPLEGTTMEQIRAQFETNFFGLAALTKAFLPHFREHGTGTIINVSSLSAENGYPFNAVYSASKAAVATLTEGLNVELDGLGIGAKAVLPGQGATKIFTKIDFARDVPDAYQPLLHGFFERQRTVRGIRPETVAGVIWEAATDGQRDRVRYYVGPDARLIPVLKRLMGQDRYFRFFKSMAVNGPNPLLARLVRQGDAEVEVDLAGLRRATHP